MCTKKIFRIAAASVMLLGFSTGNVWSAGSLADVPVTVSATLNSKCQFFSGSTGGTLTFTYDAFSATAVNATGGFDVVVDCTRGLAAPTFAFDATFGTTAGAGVVAGLAYQINVTHALTSGGTAGVTTSGTGATKAVHTYSVAGTMAAGQPGDTGDATSHTRQMTISY